MQHEMINLRPPQSLSTLDDDPCIVKREKGHVTTDLSVDRNPTAAIAPLLMEKVFNLEFTLG